MAFSYAPPGTMNVFHSVADDSPAVVAENDSVLFSKPFQNGFRFSTIGREHFNEVFPYSRTFDWPFVMEVVQ